MDIQLGLHGQQDLHVFHGQHGLNGQNGKKENG